MLAAVTGEARGDEKLTDPAVPDTEVRALVGLGFGVEAEHLLLQQRLRVGLGVYDVFNIGQARVAWRLAGSPRSALWIRGGLFGQAATPATCKEEDRAWAVDGGLEYRALARNGAGFSVALGAEDLVRDHGQGCGEFTLRSGTSAGVVADITGRVPILVPGLALYSRAGIRTADHVGDMPLLPELWLGLAYAFGD